VGKKACTKKNDNWKRNHGKEIMQEERTTGKKHNKRTCKKEATGGRNKSMHGEKKDLTIVGLGFL
jgi:hypothetical protein